VSGPANFRLEIFKLKPDVGEWATRWRASGGRADMKSIHRSNLMGVLLAGAALAAVMMMDAPRARAEIVTVQGDDGAAGADGVSPGDPGLPGGNGESVTGSAGSA
jgi:hypothetical protein